MLKGRGSNTTGSAAERSDFVQEKVQFWTQCVSRLADAAIKEPQDAYAALTT